MSTCKALPTSSKTTLPGNIIFFDTESRVDSEITDQNISDLQLNHKIEKKHDLYLICADFVRKDKKHEYYGFQRDYHSETLKQDFWIDVDNFTTQNKKVYMFAHNAKYDVIASGCIHYMVDLGYTVESFSDSSPFFLCLNQTKCPVCDSWSLEEDDNNFWCDDCGLRFLSKHAKRKNITILSSTNYYQFPLKNLGECFGLEKLDSPDFKNATVEESIVYCRRDVDILKLAMLEFIKFIKLEDLGGFKMTVAGQSFSAFRHKFLKENTIFLHRTVEALKVERGSYAGGRNEVFRRGKITEDIYYVDFNSMYPFVMKNEQYPTKMITYKYHATVQQLQYYINEGYLVCASVRLNTNRRVFFKKDKRLLFPVGEFDTYISTPEIISGLKNKEIKKVYEICVYEKADIFSGFVDYFYNKRLEAKSLNDEVRSLLYKIILNSLYGKFGQKNNNWELIGRADPKEVRTENIIRNGERFTVKVFGGGVFKRVELPDGEGEAVNSFPAISAHVTAYARMLLFNSIQTAGEENTYYMDTDSLFLNKKGYDNLIKKGLIDENELGKMKLEYTAHNVEIRGCKDYKFDYTNKKGKEINVDKIKGVSKSSKKIDDNNFASTVWGGLAGYIKAGDLDGYKNTVIIKKLSREYTKGVILKDGVINPFVYVNNENVLEVAIQKDIQELEVKLQVLKEYNKSEIDIIRKKIIKEYKGLKPEKNGAYAEELKHFKYPIRNFESGTSIDRVVQFINDDLGKNYNSNDLLDILNNNNSSVKKDMQEIRKQIKFLKGQNISNIILNGND